MESKKINQLATAMAPASSDLTIIGDPITGVSKKITWLQVSTLIGTAANLQQVTDNGATTTNPIAIGGLTITGLATGVLKSNSGVIASVPFGAANGVATLGGDGKVPSSQLPSYVDDVVEVANYAALPAIGETGKIYITLDNNKVYRWTGSIYVEIAANNAVWGAITGTLSNQTDLQNALNTKLSSVGLSMPSGFSVASSPLTSNGTIAVTGAGNSTQYLDGTGALQTFPTLLSSDNLVKLVRNQSGATMTAGTVIYISGATGNKPLIAKALATGDATSAQTYGIVQANIANNADGYIVIIGNVNDLDTSALTEGQQLYLSATTAGAYTTTKQYAPNHLVYVGIVLRSHPTQGIIGVKIQNGYEMDELHNVAAQSASNGDILQYVSSTSLWTKTAGTTTNIAEGTNLYFTDTRARNAISLTTTGTSGAATYTSGVLNIPNYGSALSGYVTLATSQTISGAKTFSNFSVFDDSIYANAEIRLAVVGTAAQTWLQNINSVGVVTINYNGLGFNSNNNLYFSGNSKGYCEFAFNNGGTGRTYTLQNSSGTLAFTSDLHNPVTIGTANGLSLSTQVLSLALASTSTTGALSSTDWNTFNGKQNALTNPITGTGTTNYIPKFTASGTIGNSLIYDTGTRIAIGGTSATDGVLTVQSDAGQFCIQSNTTPGKQLQIGYDHVSNNSYLSSLNQGVAFTPLALQPNGGNVGIGTATPTKLLSIGTSAGAPTNGFNILYGTDEVASFTSNAGTGEVRIGATNAIGTFFTTFYSNNAERMRITSGGNVGIGTSSPTQLLEVSSSSSPRIVITNTTNSANSGLYFNTKNSSGTVQSGGIYYIPGTTPYLTLSGDNSGTHLNITSGGNVGIGTSSPNKNGVNRALTVNASSGTSMYELCVGDTSTTTYWQFTGTDSSLINVANGYLRFGTADTERMRITSGGDFLIGKTNNSVANSGFWSTKNGEIICSITNGLNTLHAYDVTNSVFRFYVTGGGTINATNTTISSISDVRLKENITDLQIGLDAIMALRPRQFDWKKESGNSGKNIRGFIAQEFEQIFPDLIDESINPAPEGEEPYKQIRQDLIPILVKAIQELKAEIDELKNK